MADNNPKKPIPPASTQRTTMIMVIILLAVAFFVGSQFMRTGAMGTTVTDQLITSEFTQAVEQGRVKSVTYSAGDYTVSGTYFPAATAGSEAAGAFNGAFDSLNALMATEHGEDGKALGGVATTTLDPATLGKEHNYTSTYVGSDSLGELLGGTSRHLLSGDVAEPLPGGSGHASAHPHHRRPSDVLLLQDAAGQQFPDELREEQGEEDPGGAPRRDVCRCGRRR